MNTANQLSGALKNAGVSTTSSGDAKWSYSNFKAKPSIWSEDLFSGEKIVYSFAFRKKEDDNKTEIGGIFEIKPFINGQFSKDAITSIFLTEGYIHLFEHNFRKAIEAAGNGESKGFRLDILSKEKSGWVIHCLTGGMINFAYETDGFVPNDVCVIFEKYENGNATAKYGSTFNAAFKIYVSSVDKDGSLIEKEENYNIKAESFLAALQTSKMILSGVVNSFTSIDAGRTTSTSSTPTSTGGGKLGGGLGGRSLNGGSIGGIKSSTPTATTPKADITAELANSGFISTPETKTETPVKSINSMDLLKQTFTNK